MHKRAALRFLLVPDLFIVFGCLFLLPRFRPICSRAAAVLLLTAARSLYVSFCCLPFDARGVCLILYHLVEAFASLSEICRLTAYIK